MVNTIRYVNMSKNCRKHSVKTLLIVKISIKLQFHSEQALRGDDDDDDDVINGCMQ